MARESFWTGFGGGVIIGALAGAGGVLAFNRLSGRTDSRIVRLEKSINIGRPLELVFATWANIERLPQYISFVKKVERYRDHARWRINLDGKEFTWDSQVTQLVPQQSIGWKSLGRPRHTGRISFAPLGRQTVIHVVMNYAPPLGGLGAMLPIEQHLESWIEQGLREFKTAMEGQEKSRVIG